jgi:hypothetical protein
LSVPYGLIAYLSGSPYAFAFFYPFREPIQINETPTMAGVAFALDPALAHH